MDDTPHAQIETTFMASNAGQLHFGEVIACLVAAGVEAYHVDYRAGRSTCYLPDGTVLDLGFERPSAPIGPGFDAEAVRAAIRGAQQGQLRYPEFKARTQAAGCIGYTVWIAGRHVVYLGRGGESHVERFPDGPATGAPPGQRSGDIHHADSTSTGRA